MCSRRFVFLLLSVLCVQYEVADGLRILGIFPFPGKSHFILGDILMRELARRGHTVEVVSHFPSKKFTKNWTDINVLSEMGTAVNNVTYDQTKQLSGLSMSYFIWKTGTSICDLLSHPNFQKLLKTSRGTYDVIVVELFTAQCYIAFGQHLNAPVVGLVASKLHDWLFEPFANPLNPSYMPSLFSSSTQRMTFWERLQNTLLINVIGIQLNYYMNQEVDQVEKYFNRKISSLNELYNDISLVLVNEHFSLNEIKPATPDIIDVGGLHVHDSDQQLTPDLQKWLDESTAGCVYFTFGSMVKIESFPPKTLKVFYETFDKIAPVRVLMKVADPKALPPNLPKNVKTLPWMPQVAVLKHKNVKAFITHGGLLGTQEALAHSVPMVGLPIFGDQYTNIKSYENRKIAIALTHDTITTDTLTSALNAVLKDPAYRENINRISKLFLDRPMTALDTAAYWVEYTARHGIVLKSPATELTWWQFYLLDVYGFILACVLLVLFVIKKIVTFPWRCVRGNKSASKSHSVTKSRKNK